MSTVVVYESRYGSTEKYANWIGESINCKIMKASETKIEDLLEFDTIIYGGWLHAGIIKGFKLISKNIDKLKYKKLVVFSVGCCMGKEKDMKIVNDMNFKDIDNVDHFYLRGAFNYSKLNTTDKILMNGLKIKLKRTSDKNEEDKGMLDAYINPIDFTDINSIKPLVDHVTNLETTV